LSKLPDRFMQCLRLFICWFNLEYNYPIHIYIIPYK
jgi:hypothetical protein